MKKIVLILAAAMAVLCAVSCEKETERMDLSSLAGTQWVYNQSDVHIELVFSNDGMNGWIDYYAGIEFYGGYDFQYEYDGVAGEMLVLSENENVYSDDNAALRYCDLINKDDVLTFSVSVNYSNTAHLALDGNKRIGYFEYDGEYRPLNQ